MNFLLIGDIYGKIGRLALKESLPQIVSKYNISVIIANGENITHGSSISEEHYNFLKKLNIDVITTGNHIFYKNIALKYIDKKEDLLRPINMNSFLPGKGYYIFNKNNKKIMVTNVMGKTFMDHVNNPYQYFEEIIDKNKADIHIVDFHAEATSEKKAFALAFDGRITCLFGTHTHVQTSDNRILPNGTAFITDLGMTGSYNSILGADPEPIIIKERTGLRTRFEPSKDKTKQFCAAILYVDEKTNQATKLKRIFYVNGEEKE